MNYDLKDVSNIYVVNMETDKPIMIFFHTLHFSKVLIINCRDR